MTSTRTAVPAAARAFDVDGLLPRLLAAATDSPQLQQSLPQSELEQLLRAAYSLLLSQPMLLELTAPLTICGDVHGQYFDLLRIFDMAGWPSATNYLFLGDYVDRGKHSLHTIVLMLALKLKHPQRFFMLRGNHECRDVNRWYGFYDECVKQYSESLWNLFQTVFDCLPFAALVENRILCMHGGLSPKLTGFNDLRQFNTAGRPLDPSNPVRALLLDLLWADPDASITGYAPNRLRGVSVAFGADVVHETCHRLRLDLVVRAHQVVQDGYEFFADKRLLTIFSAPHYCGTFNNAAAILRVDKQLLCSFHVYKPSYSRTVQVQLQASHN